ncbi:MAG: NAD(P)/FAD-dependent oxidoreductase [Solirubrobacterales bacterium]
MARAASNDAPVAVVGGGVVGCAVALALARRGAPPVLLEGERELCLGASGTNSGVLHTGFDSPPGELETRLILRSAALRDPVLDGLSVPVLSCGAELAPRREGDRDAIAALGRSAEANGVSVGLRGDGVLEVPGESVTDPVAYTLALAAAADALGADVRTGARVEGIERRDDGLALACSGGDRVRCRVVVNCAGLYADEVARLAGDDGFEIYPRKGEFFVFDPPGGKPLERILLPVPTKRTKGVLVFPTVDGKVIAGPTAHDQDDKEDWSVRPEAAAQVLPKARAVLPELAEAEPVASYAGLRPAGRGVNYRIVPSPACPGLVNVAAIRSTGLSASLGIAERACELVDAHGVALTEERELPAIPAPAAGGEWWRRTARERLPG